MSRQGLLERKHVDFGIKLTQEYSRAIRRGCQIVNSGQILFEINKKSFKQINLQWVGYI